MEETHHSKLGLVKKHLGREDQSTEYNMLLKHEICMVTKEKQQINHSLATTLISIATSHMKRICVHISNISQFQT